MTTTATATIQERAQWHLDNFERGERESELPTDGKIWVLKDHKAVTAGDTRGDHPTTELVRNAHRDPDGDQMFPDDWRYEYIVDALGMIAEMDSGATDEDYSDAAYEIVGEIYTSNLTAWLNSHAYRRAYCDEAQEEIGNESFVGMEPLMMAGNAYEQRFVFESVLATIQGELA